ncbi:hypothetical protein ACTXT7_014945 [Hymenolepis weldensis]
MHIQSGKNDGYPFQMFGNAPIHSFLRLGLFNIMPSILIFHNVLQFITMGSRFLCAGKNLIRALTRFN